MFYIGNGAGANDNFRTARQNRLNEPGDVISSVLIVRVGVDNNISACLETGIEAGYEGPCQALVAGKAYYVVDVMR